MTAVLPLCSRESSWHSSYLCTHLADVLTIAGLILVGLLLFLLIHLNLRKKRIISSKSKELEETEARYQLLFQHSPISLIEADLSAVKTFLDQLPGDKDLTLKQRLDLLPDSVDRCSLLVNIRDANTACLALYGVDQPEQLAPFISILPQSQQSNLKAELLGLLQEGRAEVVLENRTADGKTLTVVRKTVIPAGYEQNWRKVFVTVINITEQVRLKNEIKSFEKQLQQTQKLEAIGSLAGGIAHDFNNLLSPIMGRAELMLVENTDDPLLQEHCRSIVDASRRARDLVRQILTFSRQVDQEITPVSIAAVITEVMHLVRSTLPADVTIECHLPEHCPRVMADATQLHQVVMNLVTNAFHAMEQRGGQLTVRLEPVTLGVTEFSQLNMSPGHYLRLTIRDTGCGIEPAAVAKIFDPYFTTKPQGKGTGLGLAVVLGILRGYGGEIRVASEIGKGTTFTLYFPVVELAVEQRTFSYDHQDPLPRGTEHILLVDDEKSVADVTASMLERLGYKVTMRVSGYDALEAFRNLADRIDLLIADLTMPQLTGLQLYKEIKAIRPEVKVIICTGFSEQLDSNKSKAIGIEGFLNKPVVMSELAQCVRAVLDGR